MRPTLRHLLFGQTPFSPRSLFAAGEVGAWYEPGSLDTLYQTSTGTTAVTAGEQPVGLVLDKSKGLALGPELVTNGGFDSGTGWTTNTGWTISGGVASFSGAVGASVTQSISFPSGKTYQIVFDLVSGSLTGVSLFGGGANASAAISGAGQKIVYITTTANRTGIGFNTAGGATAVIDNISVREIMGAHAYQTSSTLRPTYKTGPNRLNFDADPDSLLITFPSAPGNSTLAYGVSGGEPVITYPVTIGTTYTIDPSVVGTFGPELVTNGDFSQGSTGWTQATPTRASYDFTGGKLRMANDHSKGSTVGYGTVTTLANIISGKTYIISFDVLAKSGSLLTIAASDSSSGSSATTISSQNFPTGSANKVYWTATVSRAYLVIQIATGADGVYYDFDNISVRELTEAAAQNTGLVIVNRALTAAETVKLTQYLKARS